MITPGFDAQGCVTAIHTGDGGMVSGEIHQCLVDLFQDHCYPSLAGRTLDVSSHCWIA